MRLYRLIAAVALVAAAAPARAFHREEVKSSPGRCLWWAATSVTFRLNATNANTLGCASRGDAEALAQASFATWGAASFTGQPVCTNFGFAYGGVSPSIVTGYDSKGPNENLVVWRKGLCTDVAPANDPCRAAGTCADQYNCWDHGSTTIGLTTTTYNANTGEILDADMELFDRDAAHGTGFWFTCAGPGSLACGTSAGGAPNPPTTSCVSMDLGSTITHEAGHMLGLAHSCDASNSTPECSASTMYASAGLGDTQKRTLHPDDVAGVCTIYPAGGAPSPAGGTGESGATCAALPASSSSPKNGGCGLPADGPASAALLLALAGLARLVRRR
jgi:hypothetical protein